MTAPPAGVVKGKIAFMSPEQAHGQALDERSDLFSLGTLLYLVTTGVRPFEAATDFEVIARVQKCLYRPPEKVSPEMPESLGAVIRRALTADRDQRYRTADQLLVDLEAVWRSEYGAPGQTELKLWLAELTRIDGSAPLGRTGIFGPGREGGSPGDLAEGAALVLGDESSEQQGMTPWVGEREVSGIGKTAVAGMILPEIGALEDSLPDSATRSERLGPRRRVGNRQKVTGVEATAMSDLSLIVADDSDEIIARMRGRSRRRAVGTGFLVFLLLGGGAATALWRLSLNRRVEGWGARESGAAPLVEPEAQAGLPAPAPRLAAPPRGEPRHERVQPRIDSPRAEAAAAAATAREIERRAARERRWSLPSNELDTLPNPPVPGVPLPPPAAGEVQIAPPPVGEILPAPSEEKREEKEPARPFEAAPDEPRPGVEPATVPKVGQPQWQPPPRQEPPAQENRPEATP